MMVISGRKERKKERKKFYVYKGNTYTLQKNA